jgi:hypothetical protein
MTRSPFDELRVSGNLGEFSCDAKKSTIPLVLSLSKHDRLRGYVAIFLPKSTQFVKG